WRRRLPVGEPPRTFAGQGGRSRHFPPSRRGQGEPRFHRLPDAPRDRGPAGIRAHRHREGRRFGRALRREQDAGGGARSPPRGRFRDPLARLARLRSDLRLLPAPADRAPSARGRGGRGRGRRGAGPHGRGSCLAARADAAGCAVADLATAVVCLGAGGPDPPARRRARLAPIPPRGRGGGGSKGDPARARASPSGGRGKLARGRSQALAPPSLRGPGAGDRGPATARPRGAADGGRGLAGGHRGARGASGGLRAGALRAGGDARLGDPGLGARPRLSRGAAVRRWPVSEVWSTAARAHRAFHEGDYQGAALHFERLVELGAGSADVWFNLGAAHYRAGRKGHAAWAWENALRVDPGDEEARAALERLREELPRAEVRIQAPLLDELGARLDGDLAAIFLLFGWGFGCAFLALGRLRSARRG